MKLWAWWLVVVLVALADLALAQVTTRSYPSNTPIGIAGRCARFDANGVLSPASGDCSAGDTANSNGNDIFINDAPNFVGRVFCPGAAVTDGTCGCYGTATQFATKVLTDGVFNLYGCYVAANPSTASNGFKVTGGTLDNHACNSGAPYCGGPFQTLATALASLSSSHNGELAGFLRGMNIDMVTGNYLTDPNVGMDMSGQGWHVRAIGGPVTIYWDKATVPDVALSGTGTTNIAGDVTKITFSTTQCTSNCAAGAGIRPTDKLCFGCSASGWDDATKVVVTVDSMTADGLTFKFTPKLVSDFSGTVRKANGHLMQIDNQSATANFGPMDLFYKNIIDDDINFACTLFCQGADPFATAGARTTGGGYRGAPITALRILGGWSLVKATGRGLFCFPADNTFAFSSNYNVTAQTFNAGVYEGWPGGCGDYGEVLNQLYANDDTARPTVPRPSAAILMQGPGLYARPTVLTSPWGRFFWGTRLSLFKGDFFFVEDAAQLVYIATWYQNVLIEGWSQDQLGPCGGSGQPACEASAAMPPWVETHSEVDTQAGALATITMRGQTAATNLRTKPKLFEENGTTGRVRVELTGAFEGFAAPTFGSNKTVLVGSIQCKVNSTDCNQPANAIVKNFCSQDLDGNTLYGGSCAP
jgi:hypothetical protein